MLRLLLHTLAVLVGLEGASHAPEPSWAIEVPPPSAFTAAALSPAASALAEPMDVDVHIDKARVLKINGDKLYPFDPTVQEIDLVIFWPGLGYGTQRMVLEHERYGVGPALAAAGIESDAPSRVMVLVVKEPRRPWKQVARTIARLESEYGVRVRSKVLGCWSGGASGASTALNADEHFAGWFMADPSPTVARRRSWPKQVPTARLDSVHIWRNVNNWGALAGPGGFYRRDIDFFLERVSVLDAEDVEIARNHKELLLMGLTAAITAASSQVSPSLYDGLAESTQ